MSTDIDHGRLVRARLEPPPFHAHAHIQSVISQSSASLRRVLYLLRRHTLYTAHRGACAPARSAGTANAAHPACTSVAERACQC